MKLTKYAQSCFLIEAKGLKILIDPGNLLFDYQIMEEWNKANIILITHKHQDHCHAEVVKKLIQNGAALFSSKEIEQSYPELKVHLLKAGDVLNYKGVQIEVTKAVHGYIPALKGREVKENIGFIISDGEKKIYVTSDTIGFSNEHQCDVLCLPVSNHGLTFGAIDAAMFAKETGAGIIIPTHYDNPKYPADLEAVKKEMEKAGLNCKVMGIKESIEV